MGFVGSINQDLRSILREMAPRWRGVPVYVGCSGNFTVERILRQAGVTEIHSNDVSLYSCALGMYLSGGKLDVQVKVDEWRWLEPYMEPGVPLISTLLLCTQVFQYAGRTEPYFVRMYKAYRDRWPQLHAQTVERVQKALEGMAVASFSPMDVVDFVAAAPEDAVVISFPPTYKAGYERMYRMFDAVFEWAKPDYVIFDDNRFFELIGLMQEKREWVTLKDREVPELGQFCRGRVQTTLRSRPVYVYCGARTQPKLTAPKVHTEPLLIPRLSGPMEGELDIVPITVGQMNTLRSQYLSPSIAPATMSYAFGITVGGQLIGAAGFTRTEFSGPNTIYMMTDFAVRPTLYPRLSKLVLVAVLSKEMKAILEQRFTRRIDYIVTTAFTDKPVSMKYRGLFELIKRGEGYLNYQARTGRWTLREGLEWWKRHHGQMLSA